MPAAYNVTAQQISTKIRLMKIEQSKYVLDQEAGDNGSVHIYPLTPTNNSLFPILAGTADSYTKWRMVSLKIEYRPKVGTDAEGTVYMGHTPQYTPSTDTYPSIQVISGMPRVVSTSVRQGAVLQIPLTGKDKFMRKTTDEYDPSLYYEGTVVVSAYGPAKEEVGEIWAHYVVDMIQPKVNTENTTSAVAVRSGVIHSSGLMHITNAAAGEFEFDSILPATMLIRTDFTGAAPVNTVQLNGEEITANFTETGTTKQFALYRLGVQSRGALVEVASTGTIGAQTALVFPSVNSF